MDWLNYHHLLYFWTVARLGTVSAAAEELMLRPQTISGQLKLLDQSVGQPLFERAGRGLVLSFGVALVAVSWAFDGWNNVNFAAGEIRDDVDPQALSLLVVALIGALGVVAFPVEAFVELGLEVKAKSPFETTIPIELANGCFGYCPTVEGHRQGGYETWLTVNRVEKGAEPKLVEKVMELFETAKK